MKYGISVLMLMLGAALAAQEKEVPKDSIRISIPGCAKGSAFVVMESPEAERTNTEIREGRRFRLTGKRDVLDEIKKREGNMIEVTGIIKKADYGGGGGITTGGGRVRIGGGPPVDTGVGATRAPQSMNAILDVEGFRPLAASCPRN
jgi:hypothetical protein